MDEGRSKVRLHPFHTGCMYKTGVACLDQGKIDQEGRKFRGTSVPLSFLRDLNENSQTFCSSESGSDLWIFIGFLK